MARLLDTNLRDHLHLEKIVEIDHDKGIYDEQYMIVADEIGTRIVEEKIERDSGLGKLDLRKFLQDGRSTI